MNHNSFLTFHKDMKICSFLQKESYIKEPRKPNVRSITNQSPLNMESITTACCYNFLLHKINKGDLKKTLAMFDDIEEISKDVNVKEKLEKLALAKEGIVDENCENCKEDIINLDEDLVDNTNEKEDTQIVENERPRSSLLTERERRPSS